MMTRKLQQLSIRQRFRLLLAFSLAGFAVCGGVVLYTLSQTAISGPIYRQIMLGQDLVADILPPPAYLVGSYLTVLQLADAPDPAARQRLMANLRKREAEYYLSYHRWSQSELPDDLREKVLRQSHSLVQDFYRTAYDAFEVGHAPWERNAAFTRLDSIYTEQRQVVEQTVKLAREYSLREELYASRHMRIMAAVAVAVLALMLLMFLHVYNTVQRSIADPILEALKITRKLVSDDDDDAQLRDDVHDEAALLLQATREIIQTSQSELIRAGKLASLGSLVAGMAHELNTPIGNGLMAATALRLELREFRAIFGGAIKRTTVESFLRTAESGIDMAIHNLQRAATLVDDFKLVAVDRAGMQRREFNLYLAVQDALLSLQPLLLRTRCKVVQRISPAMSLDSFPEALIQALTKIIENAAIHAYGGSGGVVTLTASLNGRKDTLLLHIGDQGCGMPEHLRQRLFEPFSSTRLGTGVGLGLHIAHSNVHRVLGGSLRHMAGDAGGAGFELAIPLAAPSGPG